MERRGQRSWSRKSGMSDPSHAHSDNHNHNTPQHSSLPPPIQAISPPVKIYPSISDGVIKESEFGNDADIL